MIKKLKNYVLAFVILLGLIGVFALVSPLKVNADALRTRDEAVQWARSQVEKTIGGGQCVDFIKSYYTYLGVAPVTGNGTDYTWNALPANWVRIPNAQPQPGDILVYTGGYGHVGIYEADRITYHQNFGDKQKVRKITFAYNGMTNPYWGVIRPTYKSNIPSWVQVSNVRISNVTNESYQVTCDVASNTGIRLIQFGSWNTDIHTGHDSIWVNAVVSGNTATATIKISTLKSGIRQGNYITHIYAYDNSGKVASAASPTIFIDRTIPKISNVRISDITKDSYKVTCDVSDNVKVKTVQFGSWNTDIHTGHDSVWVNGAIKGSTATATIDIKSLKSGLRDGNYITHIYAYDEAGNSNSAAFPKVYIGAAKTVTKASQKIDADSYTKVYGSKAFILNVRRTAGDGKLSYSSSNSKVAAVSANGKITIKGTGKVLITIKAEETTKYKKASKTITITIKPKKVAAPVVKSNAKKKVEILWKRDIQATGYQIQYSTSSSFKSGNKTLTINKNSIVKKAISGLKRKKIYYVRMRAYKIIDRNMVYGKWSSKKSVKIK